jgi:hypothetical protein
MIATDRKAHRSFIARRGTAILAAFVVFVLQAFPTDAHHAFTAEFDINNPVTLAGRISRTEWINPHVHIFLNADAGNGEFTAWRLESWGTGNCRRAGLLRNNLTPGTPVTVLAYRAKDGTKNFGYRRSIQFENGARISLWVGGSDGTPEEQGLL